MLCDPSGLLAVWGVGQDSGFPQEHCESRVTPFHAGVRQDLGFTKGAVRLQWPCGVQSWIWDVLGVL